MIPCFRCNGQMLQFQDDLGPRCVQCGQTVSPPTMAPEKDGTWQQAIHEFKPRATLLIGIDRRIAAEAGKEAQRQYREQKLASALKRRSLAKKVVT